MCLNRVEIILVEKKTRSRGHGRTINIAGITSIRGKIKNIPEWVETSRKITHKMKKKYENVMNSIVEDAIHQYD